MTDKAQEHNFPKYNLDADFWRNRWCEASAEALQQQLRLIKLEKKLAAAVEALKEISKEKIPFRNGCFYGEETSEGALKAKQALAEIGGEDE